MPERFPLTRHKTGQWAKKFQGRRYYFGLDKEAALRRYVAEWPSIKAGLPRPGRSASVAFQGVSVAYLCNAFLAARRQAVESGELSPATWNNYRRVTIRVLAALGRDRDVATLQPADYARVRAEAARTLGPTSLTLFVQLARALFNFGETLTDRRPKYGDQFDAPPRRVLRLHRERRGERMLEPDQLRQLIGAAGCAMRAQILLGLNCGFGATDLSELRQAHLEAKPGWVVLPRRKTGLARRCPLWPETVAAIDAAWQCRAQPKDPADADRVFLSPAGRPCVRWVDGAGGRPGSAPDAIAGAWGRLCARAGVKLPKGTGFYVLRHVFRTVADEVPDRVVIDRIMGHRDDSMGSFYRERVDDSRFLTVTEHVRRWLLGGKK